MKQDGHVQVLVDRLAALEPLRARRFVLEARGHDAIIMRNDHVHGTWRVAADRLHYFPAGYNEPTHIVRTVRQAVDITFQMFERQRAPRGHVPRWVDP